MVAVSAVTDLYAGGDRLDDLGDDECKFAVADKAPFDTSATYWREYARLCKIVASHPEGTFLNQIAAELHGRGEVSSGDTEYQRIRRFLSSHPQFFEVRRSNGLISAAPTLELLDLIKRGIIQRGPEEACTAGSQYEGSREFCQSMLQSIQWDRQAQELVNDKGRDLLETNFSEYLDRINDLRLVLRSEYADPEYITLPYKTRFNDEGRIKKQHAILGKSLDEAAKSLGYEKAALVTLTTDPKMFDSLWEMWAGDPDDGRSRGINGNWNRFMSWLSADSRLGSRPDYVKVLEATEKGMPHLHAVVFLDDDQCLPNGMPWMESKNAVSNYWGKYQGTTVDLQPLVWEDDLPDDYDADEGWVRWSKDGDHGGDLGDGDGGGQTAGEYLGKYLSAIYGGIRSAAGIGGSSSGGQPVMTDGGRDLAEDELGDGEKYEDKAATWKVAMYWATNRKIRTESRDLRQQVEKRMEDEEDEDGEDRAALAEVVRENEYEFVGAYRYGEIPAHVRNGAVPIDSLLQSIEEDVGEVDAFQESDPPPKPKRIEKLRRKFPASAWPLLEGLHGGERP